ncbi:MAG TPA: hypothetical protein VM406_02355 [Noviherbaspirillum sp.]|nr:hypothetical protein [Noviherbaspirillum sp.]
MGILRSRMGAFFPGTHVIFRGHDLHTELKDMDWVELYVFGITGRRFTSPQLRLLHAIWTTTSYPDGRIWNNRVAGLAGSVRSTGNLGMAAALAVSEASIYGRGIDKRAIDFLIRTRQRVEAGERLEQCVREELDAHRSIAGYGRPVVNGDERNPHMLALCRDLGLDQGAYLELALQIEHVLLEGRWRMKMNYGGLAAALCADLGLSPREYYLFMFPAFLAGMPPCYIEASDREAGSLYPTPCDGVAYDGPARRQWHGGK